MTVKELKNHLDLIEDNNKELEITVWMEKSQIIMPVKSISFGDKTMRIVCELKNKK